MTREEGFALANELADAGFSSAIHIGIAEKMSPREHVSVHVRATRLEAVNLMRLIEIGRQLGLELHLLGDDLRFIEMAKKGQPA